MITEAFKRKLTTILSADVAGYSRLMGEDEAATVKTLTTYRKIMAELIKQHRGRVVDSPGDNLLAEFTSVVDAVQCAVAAQNEFKARNEELPENRRMEFRIGINLGDVIEEGDRIYGDGVNIAARLEALADPCGICISKTAFDQIETKLPLGYEFLGEQSVKNIAKPVGAYRVLMEPRVIVAGVGEEKKAYPMRSKAIFAGAVAVLVLVIAVGIWYLYLRPTPPGEVASLPLPDEPSIAVLPFDNLSGDPEQDHFSDGIMDSIITQLYKIPDLFVIAKQSSRIYKGKAVPVQQIGRELGVRYVLEGSVQKVGDRIRMNAQLIDAVTGNHVWAEIYDRELTDVFAVQDEITRSVVTELGGKLTWGEALRSMRHATENHQAADLYLQADLHFMRFEKEENIKARKLLLKAIELDPDYARAIAFLAATHSVDGRYKWVKDPALSFRKTEELALRAVAMDDNTYLGHLMLSHVYGRKRMFDQSLFEAKRALEVEPGNAIAVHNLGRIMIYIGRPEEGLVLYKKALRLAPYPPPYILFWAGSANYLTGRYEAAIDAYRKVLARYQHGAMARLSREWLIAGYMELGREEKARAEARKMLEQHPDFSIEKQVGFQKLRFKDQSIFDRHIELLRKAGLPE